MRKATIALSCLAVIFILCGTALAGVAVTTGAGYKTMAEALCKAYREDGGAIEEMYGGHIGQMLMQIQQGSGANVVISDKGTLDAVSGGVAFDSYQSLGKTALVLAWRKGITLTSPASLAKPEVESVCAPDAKAAIFGRAAASFLEGSGIGKQIEGKLSIVSSVPQAFSYLVTGEMDAAFVNRVMILNGADKIGGSLEIEEGYPPLDMTAAVVAGSAKDPDVARFLAFLRSPKAKEILKKNGIW